MPQIIILAGPNGAGKSTLAARIVPRGVPFLNADDIARDRGAEPGPSADLAAGRILLRRVAEMESNSKSFAIETNLANRSLATRIPTWQAQGYHVALVFVWLPSADIAVDRVAKRVCSGGHDIPEVTIRRRYDAGRKMFFSTYRHLVDSWRLLSNSDSEGFSLMARASVRDWTLWKIAQTGGSDEE